MSLRNFAISARSSLTSVSSSTTLRWKRSVSRTLRLPLVLSRSRNPQRSFHAFLGTSKTLVPKKCTKMPEIHQKRPKNPPEPHQNSGKVPQLRGKTKLMPFISVATPPTLFSEHRGACVMNSEERLSCHGWMLVLSLRTSRPAGPRHGSSQGDRRS